MRYAQIARNGSSKDQSGGKGERKLADIAIIGGLVVDGIGNPPKRLDVAIVGDQIVELADKVSRAQRTINAAGKVVCPGFIDVHSHSDLAILVDPKANSKVRQGVTTEVVGNCGFGVAPLLSESVAKFALFWAGSGSEWYGVVPTWKTMGEYFTAVEQRKPAINVAALASHGTLRFNVMGDEARAASDSEISKMEELLRESMESGAWGLSSGLRYKPGCFAKADELVRLCRVVTSYDGLYSTHLRSEGDNGDWFEAIREAVNISLESHVPLQVSHLKALGKSSWNQSDKVLALFDILRAQGMNLTADQYPYDATQTGLTVLLPSWARPQDIESMPPEKIVELREHLKTVLELRGGPSRITIVSSSNQRYIGKSIEWISREKAVSPQECILSLIIETAGKITMVSQSMLEDEVQRIMKKDYVMVASDGYALSKEGLLASGVTHPRSYGTFPRILGRYVRDLHVLPLEEAVRKMTSLPAKKFGFEGRGKIEVSGFADLVVFDPLTVVDRSTYSSPTEYPAGIDYVIVNGKVVIANGEHTNDFPGKVLRKQRKSAS